MRDPGFGLVVATERAWIDPSDAASYFSAIELHAADLGRNERLGSRIVETQARSDGTVASHAIDDRDGIEVDDLSFVMPGGRQRFHERVLVKAGERGQLVVVMATCFGRAAIDPACEDALAATTIRAESWSERHARYGRLALVAIAIVACGAYLWARARDRRRIAR